MRLNAFYRPGVGVRISAQNQSFAVALIKILDFPMFRARKFKIAGEDIVRLLSRPMGAGLASDHITVDGRPVGFMYREEPINDVDSGWRFLSGEESQDYIDDADNMAIYDLNTIANYDPTVIPFLDSAIGTELERVPGTNQFRFAR